MKLHFYKITWVLETVSPYSRNRFSIGQLDEMHCKSHLVADYVRPVGPGAEFIRQVG